MCFLTELVSASEVEIKKAVADGVYLDYVVKDGQFYVTFMSTVREDMDKVAYTITLIAKTRIRLFGAVFALMKVFIEGLGSRYIAHVEAVIYFEL